MTNVSRNAQLEVQTICRAARFSSLCLLVGVVLACSGNSNLGGSAGNVGGDQGQGGAAIGTGGRASGGAVSSGCTLTECFRNVECVVSCGGPVVQSGCCPCPSGSFDSIQCQGAGGATSVGGNSSGLGGAVGSGGSHAGGVAPSGGAASNGGAVSLGGASSSGGATPAGGTTSKGGTTATGGANSTGGSTVTGGASSRGGAVATGGTSATGGIAATAGASNGGSTSMLECKTAADCNLVGDCCGCHAIAVGQTSGCMKGCLDTNTCAAFNPLPTAQCIHGRCTLDRSCDDASGTIACEMATPQCGAGKLPSLNSSASCWDGNCIDVMDCRAVRSCADCDTATQICVVDNGFRAVYHCVDVTRSCNLASRCACFSELCAGMSPCNDLSNGISCGGG